MKPAVQNVTRRRPARSGSTRAPRRMQTTPATKVRVRTRPAEPRPPARPALLLPGLIIGLLVLWAPFAPRMAPRPSRVWRGYDLLMVRAGSRAEARLPAAAARLGPGVVSRSTATVDFYDFTSSTRVSYADLPRRLDPLDPRRDSYLEGIAGYFSLTTGVAEWHVAYIPARWTALSLYVKLRGMLGPSGRSTWRLVDFDPLEKALSVAAMMVFAGLLTFAGGRRRGLPALAAAGTLAWVPAVLAGGPATLALCLLLLFFWFPLLRARVVFSGKGRTRQRTLLGALEKPFLLYLGAAVVSLAVYSFLCGQPAVNLAPPIGPLIFSLILLGLVPRFQAVREELGRAKVFARVPLVGSDGEKGRGRQRALSAALVFLCCIALVPLSRGGAFPAPLPLLGARTFSWDAVARLHERPRADQLPDFSDLVAHEAYQQTLGFGRKWSFPHRDERVYRSEYLVNPATGAVSARLRIVKSFDSPWLESVSASPTPGSIEALLISQGRPVAAAVRGPARALAADMPFVVVVFFAFLGMLGWDLRLGLLIRDNLWRLNGVARRDQVP
ncbi:MAG: hypothetical protein ABSG17_18110 [Spirochaetia bacterium]